MTVHTAGVAIPVLSATTATIGTVVPTYVRGGSGAVGSPIYSFAGDTDTGIYRYTHNNFRLSAGGVDQMTVSTAGIAIPNLSVTNLSATNFTPTRVRTTSAGTVAAPAYSFNTDTDTGVYNSGANQIGFSTAGVNRMTVYTSGVTIPALASTEATIGTAVPTYVRGGSGSAAAPVYSFSGDTDTGMYRYHHNSFGFASNGLNKMSVNTAGVTIPNLYATHLTVTNFTPPNVRTNTSGTALAPTYSFTTDTDTGMYRYGIDEIGFASAGISRMIIDNFGNIGIGTMTPTESLHVAGNARLTGALYDSSNGSGVAGQVLASTGSGINWVTNTSTDTLATLTCASGEIAKYNGTSWVCSTDNGTAGSDSDWTVSGSNMFSAVTGNVGIGTASPTTKLSVVGNVGATRFDSGNGTAAAPAYRFAGDPGNGMYYAGADSTGFASNGANKMTVNTAGVTIPTLTSTTATVATMVPTRIRGNSGLVASPVYSFATDTDTGIYNIAADQIGFATAGVNRMTVNNVGVTIPNLSATNLSTTNFTPTRVRTSSLGTVTAPAYSFNTDTNTGIYSAGAEQINFATAGVNRMTVNTAGVTIPVLSSTTTTATTMVPTYVRGGSGAATTPVYSFNGDTDTGIYNAGVNQIGLATAGVNRMTVNTVGVTIPTLATTNLSTTNFTPTRVRTNSLGSAPAPAYSFTTDTNTGIYSAGAEQINFATAGVNRMTVNTAGVIIPVLSSTTTTATTMIPTYVRGGSGSAAAPVYSFNGDTNTGMYRSIADQIDFSTAGINRMSVNYIGTGFGTAAPSQRLHVQGNARITGAIYDSLNQSGTAGQVLSSTATGTDWITFTGSDTLAGLSCVNGEIAKYNGTSWICAADDGSAGSGTDSDWTVSGNNMFSAVTGNVGIGTTSPTSKLTVVGNTSATRFASGTGTVAAPAYAFAIDPDTGMYRTTTNSIGFASNASNKMTINTAGVTIPTLAGTTATFTTVAPSYVRGGSGSVGAPVYSFSGDTNTGIYRPTVDQIGFATGAANRMTVSNAGVTIPTLAGTTATIGTVVPTYVRGGSGSVGAPIYSFNGDTNTGIYRPTVDQIGFATGAANRMTVSNAGVTIPTLTATNLSTTNFTPTRVRTSAAGTAAAPAYSFNTDADIGMYRTTVNSLGFAAAGINRMTVNTAGVTIPALSATTATIGTVVPTYVRGGSGSAAAPVYSFSGDTNTGIYRPTVDQIGFATGAANRMTINNAGVTIPAFATALKTPNGTSALPAYAFTGDTNTGMYRLTTDQIGFATAGTNRMTIGSTGNVGIGVSPSAQLHTTGTVRFATFGAGTLQTDASGNLSVSSDERLKNVQGNFNRGLNDLLNISPISFTWKDETGYDTENMYYGFSAQNINNAIPEAVGKDQQGYLTLSDRPILATAINAIQEQNIQVSQNTQQARDLSLQTDTNISTLAQTTSSVVKVQDDSVTNKNNILSLRNDVDIQTNLIDTINKKIDAIDSEVKAIDELQQSMTSILLVLDEDKLVYTDDAGDLTLEGVINTTTIIADEVIAGRFVINNSDEAPMTGVDTICKIETVKQDGVCIPQSEVDDETIQIDYKSTFVKTSAIKENSRVMVTPHAPVAIGVVSIDVDKGFEVQIDNAKEDDVVFDWFIVDEE